MNINQKKLIRGGLIIILFSLVTFSWIFERVPVGSGAGWDGQLYREIAANFDNVVEEGGLSSYYVSKSLPFVAIYGTSQLFNIHRVSRILFVFIYISLAIGILGFYKIVKYNQLSFSSEIIAFALCFYIYPILKLIGYYPWLGDHFAYPLGLWIYYFFISKQRNRMLLLSIIGAFIWQSILPIAVLLYILPLRSFSITNGKNVSNAQHRCHLLIKILLCLFLCSLPLVRMFFAIQRVGYSVVDDYLSIGSVITMICMGMFAYFIIQPINFNIIDAIKFFWRNIEWKRVIIGVSVYIFVNFVIYLFANKSIEPPVSNTDIIKRLVFEPFSGRPLKFLECHLIYYGLLIPLLIVLYRDILVYVERHSIAYLGIFFFSILMGTQCESRFILNLVPFMLFPIVTYLSKFELKKWVAICVVFAQLFFSRIWFRINVAGLEEALNNDISLYKTSKLAQRYFIAHGPWQGNEAYYIYSLVLLALVILLIIGNRKKFFVK